MSSLNQLRGGSTVRSQRAVPFAQNAVQQYLACLATTGQLEMLEDRFRKAEAAGNGFVARYQLALALAFDQKAEDSLVHLRALIAGDHDSTDARKLAYRLLVHKAQEKALSQDWVALAEVIAEALRLSPLGTDPATDLGTFRHAVPVGHMCAGNRKEAAKIWEQQLQQDPHDTRLIHNLALLHYWSARGGQNGSPPAVLQWRAAIAYWAALVNLEPFWTEWRASRNKAWGFDFSAPDLDTFRNGLIEEQLDHFFQAKADEHTQKNEATAARVYEDCLTASMLERKSAACWRNALRVLPADKSRPALLSLPGGVAFFQRFGLLSQIALAVGDLAKGRGGADAAATLHIYFSESGLGTAAVLSEEMNKPDEALRLLDQLPKPARDSVDACYVRALALARKATNLCSHGSIVAALKEWKIAHDGALEAQTRSTKATLFDDALAAVRNSVCQQAVAAVQKEASRLKKEGKLSEAISLLESGKPLDKESALLEFLCIYLCDRGAEKLGKSDFSGAREDLNKVLALKPRYQRALQVLSWVYNKEGCEEQNADRSISLFEKALELQPDYHVAKRNLALELKGKAVSIYNALNQYNVSSGIDKPIQLLERAVNLIGTGLKSDALITLKTLVESDANAAENLVSKLDDDSVYGDLVKKVLSDLVTMYKVKKQIIDNLMRRIRGQR